MKRAGPLVAMIIGLAFAGTSGFFVATSVGATDATRTVTINVATGPQGPKGDPGPQGPKGEKGERGLAGGTTCPAGFSDGTLVINHPGGQTTISTCIKD